MEKIVTKTRTNKQNKALHLMYEHLAQKLNESGWDMKKTLKQEIDIAWTKESVKEYLWRPIMEAMLKKESTKDLTTKDIDQVMDTLTRYLGDRLGIQVDFPSIETLLLKERINDSELTKI